MADSTTTILALTEPEVGASTNTWGGKLNTNLQTLDDLIAKATTISTTSGTVSLSTSQQQTASLKCTAALVGNLILQFNRVGLWAVYNGTSGSYSVTAQISGQASPPTITQGTLALVMSDGTNCRVLGAFEPTALTEDTSPDAAADFLITYDVSASATKKAKLNSFAGYRFGSVQVFTASGTWTRPSGCRAAHVRLVGGGGGGGGGINSTSGASGGSAGGGSEKWITSPGSTETVTIGAGGAGGTSGGGTGTAGGTTSFGSHCSATGGGAGKNALGSNAGGAGSSGDINITGGRGMGRLTTSSSGAGGNGATAPFGLGTGGAASVDTGPGDGTGYGSGGAGARASAEAGGAGASGIVIVYEYY